MSKHDKPKKDDQDTVSTVEDHAGVKFPPPLMVLTVILTAWLMGREWPIEMPYFEYSDTLGMILTALSGAIILVASVHFKKAKTSILPFRKSSHIIDTGIFSLSRNPIYLAFLLAQSGVGFWFGDIWILLALPVTYLLLKYKVITKEEAYLTRTFGDEYKNYLKKVRRWL